MRKPALIAFAFSAVVTSTLFCAQTASSQDFPWQTESGVQPVVLPELFGGMTQAPAASPLSGLTKVTQGLSWRTPSGVQPVVLPELLHGNTVTPDLAPVETNLLRLTKTAVATQSTDAATIPAKRNPSKVSFRKRQEPSLNDSQPSESDVTQSVVEAVTEEIPEEVPEEVQGIVRLAAPPEASSVQYPSEPALVVESNASTDQPDYCCRNCQPDRCNLGCQWNLFGKTCSGLEVGGWVSLGYHNRDNILLNNRSGEANVHQTWLYFDKAASRDCCDWSIGYHADLVYGIDAQDLQAFGNAPTGAPTGWDNSWDFGSYGWALPQLYLQFANADWDVKVGKFFSPFGYEVVAAPDNFFYSHSFTMYNSEPFTMTGILAERRISENRSMILGVTAGWDTGFEDNDGGNIITGTRYQPNEYVDLALTTSLGDTGVRDTGTMTSGVAQLQLTRDLKYVLQADVLSLKNNQEFGIVQYLFRDVNPCLGLGARLEWWKSNQFFASTRSSYEFTVGLNYRRNANLTFRPELRFDWGAAAIDPGEPIIGFDAVMTF